MAIAEQGEVRQRCWAALRPVTDVMALAEAHSAARRAAAAVPVVQRPTYRRGNRPGAGIDLHDSAVPAVSHHHPAGVARQALRRSRGNARPVLQDRLARRLGVRQHLGIDVDHYLVALARRAGVDAVMESRLRQQRQRVRLLPLHRRRIGLRLQGSPALIQRLAGGSQRLHEQGADLRGQPPFDPHRAVAVPALPFRRVIGLIEQGWSPVADDRLAGLDEWAVIKLSAVSKGTFVPDEHKALPADTGVRPAL